MGKLWKGTFFAGNNNASIFLLDTSAEYGSYDPLKLVFERFPPESAFVLGEINFLYPFSQMTDKFKSNFRTNFPSVKSNISSCLLDIIASDNFLKYLKVVSQVVVP